MPKHLSPDVISALKGVRFIAQHIKDADRDNEVKHDFFYCLLLRNQCNAAYSLSENSLRIEQRIYIIKRMA